MLTAMKSSWGQYLEVADENEQSSLFASLDRLVVSIEDNIREVQLSKEKSDADDKEVHNLADNKQLQSSFPGNLFLPTSEIEPLEDHDKINLLRGLFVSGKDDLIDIYSSKGSSIETSHSFRKFHEAFWFFMFPEAYNHRMCLRPDEPDAKLVKVTENRRLTPQSYDRNVFSY